MWSKKKKSLCRRKKKEVFMSSCGLLIIVKCGVRKYLTGWNILNDLLVEEYRKMGCFGAKFHGFRSFWCQNLKRNQKSSSQNPSSKSEIGT